MVAFEYLRPLHLNQCVALLRDGVDSKLLAGGQTLLGAMKLGLMAPQRLIDLSGLGALQQAPAQAASGITLGALNTHAALARSPLLRQQVPGLAQLAAGIADAQIRNRGTVGGSAANADPSACWPAGLLAVGAQFTTDRRTCAADAFFQDLFTTVLEPDEILCCLQFEPPQRFGYYKFEQAASRFAMVGVAVAQWPGQVRVALTGTARGVVRLAAMEQALGRRFTPEALAPLVVDAALFASDAHAPAAYRAHLAGLAAQRAVARAIALAP
jgi:aerobic carbon-monoxide dehydrogenase medium subunit